MYECDGCGADVSRQYWRVFAVDGTLHGCLYCQRKNGEHTPAGAAHRSAAEG